MRTLTYAVRLNPVLKYSGQLGFVLAIMSVVPLTVALILGDYRAGFRYGITVTGILLLSLGLMRIPSGKKIQTNEAMVITALFYLLVPLAMVWPMMSSGLSFLDVLYEAVSAFTTTGLSTVGSLRGKPDIFLFSRAWIQWGGGLGIVVLSLAILIQPGMVAKRLGQNENFEKDLVLNTRSHARLIFIVYAILTVVGIGVLSLLGTDFFESMLYTFAAVSTGGFSPHDLSLAAVKSPVTQFVIVLLSVGGAISFVLYYRLYHKGWRALVKDPQLQGFLIVCVITAILFTGALWWQNGFTWRQSLHHGILNALSAQTTAGFSSLNMARISNGAKLILIVSMFTGGSVGSTAGGIKILRILILFHVLAMRIKKAGAPQNVVVTPMLGARHLETDEIQNAAGLLMVFLAGIVISWMIFVFMGYPPLDSLFEVVSATGTVGLSTGISGPELHPFLKLLLGADMLMGRLEIIAWLILLSPGTWLGKRMED